MAGKEKDDCANLRKRLREKYKLKIIKKDYQSKLNQNIIPEELILELKSRNDALDEDILNKKGQSNSASKRLTQENINVCEEKNFRTTIVDRGSV